MVRFRAQSSLTTSGRQPCVHIDPAGEAMLRAAEDHIMCVAAAGITHPRLSSIMPIILMLFISGRQPWQRDVLEHAGFSRPVRTQGRASQRACSGSFRKSSAASGLCCCGSGQ